MIDLGLVTGEWCKDQHSAMLYRRHFARSFAPRCWAIADTISLWHYEDMVAAGSFGAYEDAMLEISVLSLADKIVRDYAHEVLAAEIPGGE